MKLKWNLCFYFNLPQFAHIIKRTLHAGLKIWIIFSCQKQHFTVLLPLKIKFVYSLHRILSSMLCLYSTVCQQYVADSTSVFRSYFYDFLRINYKPMSGKLFLENQKVYIKIKFNVYFIWFRKQVMVPI